jgi:mRNA-degrading endonuclease toxin of MazEF toxin-antitoxin module
MRLAMKPQNILPLRQGRIVYVTVFDSHGKNPKRRPVILVSPPEGVPEGAPLIGVAVSTQPRDPLRPEEIRLPSNRQKQGSSRLPERCVAVCDWAVQFFPQQIEEVGGMIYGELLFEILEQALPHIAHAQPPVPPPAPSTELPSA